MEFDVRNFGAKGDGASNDAPAIQSAIDECAQKGGGRVLLPSGFTFASGPIRLRSHVDFHIQTGATLRLRRKEDFEGPAGEIEYKGQRYPVPCAFIYAISEENVTVSGGGTVDGSAQLFTDVVTQYHISCVRSPRPRLVLFAGCRKVRMTDITLTNSNNWMLYPVGCEDVYIHAIHILCDLRMANSDGIDPDHCRNVRISDCTIQTADDCIVIKNTKEFNFFGPTENISISGCMLTSTSSAFKVGSETANDFRNIQMDSCLISRTNRGLGFQIRDGGSLENARFTNITIETRRFYERWWGKAEPIWITSSARDSATVPGHIRNLYFGNITCRGENGVYMHAEENAPVEHITLENVSVYMEKTSKWEGGLYERRPSIDEGLDHRDNAGIYCENVKDVTLRHVRTEFADNAPAYFGAALEVHHAEGLRLEDFTGCAAHAGMPNQIIR